MKRQKMNRRIFIIILTLLPLACTVRETHYIEVETATPLPTPSPWYEIELVDSDGDVRITITGTDEWFVDEEARKFVEYEENDLHIKEKDDA